MKCYYVQGVFQFSGHCLAVQPATLEFWFMLPFVMLSYLIAKKLKKPIVHYLLYCCVTGFEETLQLQHVLILELHKHNFQKSWDFCNKN